MQLNKGLNVDSNQRVSVDSNASSSELLSSEEDDKSNPAFWRRNKNYHELPENVRHAIEVSNLKAKHSDFYYKLKGLNEKIATYQAIFYSRVPKFHQAYMKKQLDIKQEKQKKEREVFEKEVAAMKLSKMRQNRFMSLANVFDTMALSPINNLIIQHGGNPLIS